MMYNRLDLSAAFDIIDNQFLFDISEKDWFAIVGVTVYKELSFASFASYHN